MSSSPVAIDMENRDPYAMNSFLKVEFLDVIAESEPLYSPDSVYMCAYKTYTTMQQCCYKFMAVICGGPLACFFGCYFGFLNFEYVWCIMPCTRAYLIELEFVGKIFGYCIHAFMDPCFEAMGNCFKNIRVVNPDRLTTEKEI